MASTRSGRALRFVFGLIAAVALAGVFLFVGGKRVEVPSTAERPRGSSAPATPAPHAPMTPDPGTINNPR